MSEVAEWAIKLIREVVGYIEETPVPPIAAVFRRNAQAVLDEAEEAERLGSLIVAVLNLYAEAARQVYSDVRQLMLLDAALGEMRQLALDGAADIILAHSKLFDSSVENELRDIGSADFARATDHMDEWNLAGPTLLAIVEIWVRLLPTLHTSAGLEWLDDFQRRQWSE